MKLKLLKAWTDPAGQEFAEGAGIELDETKSDHQTLIGKLLMDGIAEKIDPKAEAAAAAKALTETKDAAAKFAREQIKAMAREAVAAGIDIKAEDSGSEEAKIINGDGFKSRSFDKTGSHCFLVDVANAAKGSRSDRLNRYIETRQKAYAPEAVKVTGMNETVDSEGAILVPTEQRTQLLVRALEASIVRQRATFVQMGTNSVNIPAVVQEDRSGGAFFGGVTVRRHSDAVPTTHTTTQPALREMELRLHDTFVFVRAGNSLLEDSPQTVTSLINRAVPEAHAFVEDEDFLVGDGAAKPKGVQHGAATNGTGLGGCILVAAETGQGTDEIMFENIVKMYARVVKIGGSLVWVGNHDTFPQLATMSLPVGTGGVPVYLPANGAAGAPMGTLMGLPILFTEKVPTLGDQGDIGIYNFGHYFVGGKSAGGDERVDESMHVKFMEDQSTFRFKRRYDGRSSWSKAVTPKNGATLSPFVTLASR